MLSEYLTLDQGSQVFVHVGTLLLFTPNELNLQLVTRADPHGPDKPPI